MKPLINKNLSWVYADSLLQGNKIVLILKKMEKTISDDVVTEELKQMWKLGNIILAVKVASPAACLLKVGIYHVQATIQKSVLENGCHNSTRF